MAIRAVAAAAVWRFRAQGQRLRRQRLRLAGEQLGRSARAWRPGQCRTMQPAGISVAAHPRLVTATAAVHGASKMMPPAAAAVKTATGTL